MTEYSARGSAWLTVFLLLASHAGASQNRDDRQLWAEIRLEHVTITHFYPDSAEFDIQLGGKTLKTVSIKSIFFERVVVNGLPLVMPPLHGPLSLHQGQDLRETPALSARLAFRQVPSLKPLRDIVLKGAAHFQATAFVQLELNPLEMFALRATEAWAAVPVDQEVSVSLPGGALGQLAAIEALTAAEPVWVSGSQASAWRNRQSELAARAQSAIAGSVAAVDCTFQLQSSSGQTTTLHNRALGIIIASGRVLTTAEAVEPWTFDPVLAEALSRHEVTIVPDSVDIIAKLGPGITYSSKRAELTILRVRGGPKHMISAQTKKAYHLNLRQNEGNATCLELKADRSSTAAYRTGTLPSDGQWHSAAIFTLDFNSSESSPAVSLTEVKNESGRLTLRDASGVTANGSPVFVDNEIVGLIQSDDSAALMPDLMKGIRQ